MGIILLTITSISYEVIAAKSVEITAQTLDTKSVKLIQRPVAMIQEFDVPLGKAINGFTYTNKGELMYQGRQFTPRVLASPESVPKFHMSMVKNKKIAGAIAWDMDGQSYVQQLDLASMTATPHKGWDASYKMYWSPSYRYLVTLCYYEGSSIMSINTRTKKSDSISDFTPDLQGIMWRIEGEPKWDGQNDILIFDIDVDVSLYGDYVEPPKGALGRYRVFLDAVTMKFLKVKIQ